MSDFAPNTEVRDTRDLRDPAGMGETLQYLRSREDHTVVRDGRTFRTHLSTLADDLPRYAIPNHVAHASATEYTVPQYMRKMQQQCLEGDVSACVVLFQQGWDPLEGTDLSLLDRAKVLKDTPPEPEAE